jgi:hypothetical protein
MFTAVSPAAQRAFCHSSQHEVRLPGMEEFLASILAKFGYLVIEALIGRLIRAFMPAPAGA